MRGTLSRRILLGASFAALSCVLIIGCSKPVGTLTGQVSYKGKNLKGGAITLFNTEGGSSASGTINEDGTYKIPDVSGGSYKVCVDTSGLKMPASLGNPTPKGPPKAGKVDPNMAVPEGYTPSMPPGAQTAANAKKYIPIPETYAKPDTTDLKVTVTGGEQKYDIDLK